MENVSPSTRRYIHERYGILGPMEEFHEMRNSLQPSDKANLSVESSEMSTAPSDSSESKVDRHLASLPEDLRQAAREVVDQLPSFAAAGRAAECYRNTYNQLASEKQSVAEKLEELDRLRMETLKRRSVRGKDLMLHEGIQEGRNNKAMSSWDQAKEKWEDTTQRLSQKLGSRVESLAMESGREFCARQHDVNVFSLAKSNRERFGEEMWGTSLRENWTRYIPTGSVLNGIYCQVKPESGKNYSAVTRSGDFKQSEWQARGRSWSSNKFVQRANMRVQKALGEDAIKFMKKPFMAVSGQVVKSELEREYQEKITMSDVEERIQKSNPELYSKIMEAKSSYEEFQSSVSKENSKLSHDEVAFSGPMVALKDESNNLVWSARLSITSPPNKMNTARVWMRNLGTTVIYYEWARIPFKLGMVEEQDKDKFDSEKIQILQPKGVLLPGESKTVSVMFFAAMSGTFLSTFSLKTEPPISFAAYNGPLDIPMDTEWKNEIKVLATVSTQDNNTIKRNKIVEYINDKVKTSAIDEAIRVICDRIQPSDMPVSKIPHDPSWLSAEVEFNIQNSSLCPPVFFNPDVGSELLKLAESLGLSFQKRFSFEELERRCMGKGDQDDETTTDLSEPAEDASPAQEATDAKEADAKEAEPKPKSKSNGPAKNTKKDPEPTKKGSAQGKAAPGSERAKSIDQAKESQTKSKAEKNTKSSKPKGKNELEKAPEDDEPEESAIEEKPAVEPESQIDGSAFLPKIAQLRELTHQPRSLEIATRRAILESVYKLADTVVTVYEPLVQLQNKLADLQRSLTAMDEEEALDDEDGADKDDPQRLVHGHPSPGGKSTTDEEHRNDWSEDGASSLGARSVIIDRISETESEVEELRTACGENIVAEARTLFLDLDSTLLASLRSVLVVYDNLAPLEPSESETETSAWRKFYIQRARAGIQEYISYVQKNE